MTAVILLIIGAYLLGSVPTGLLLAKAFGDVDIRTTGSGNIGATNVYRTLGKKLGVMTLAGDCLKGLLPVLAAKLLHLEPRWVAAVGLAVFVAVLFRWRYVSLASMAAAAVVPSLVAFMEKTPAYTLMAMVVAALVIWRHRENIRRLREGTESRFKS